MNNREKLNEVLGAEIFPLFSVSQLAKRWDLSIQAVSNRSRKDPSFPVPYDTSEIIESYDAALFPCFAVREYEKIKKLGPAAGQPLLESPEEIAANESLSTAEKIRRLSGVDLSNRQIADLLNVRIQYVINVKNKIQK